MTNAELDVAVLAILQAHPDGMRFNSLHANISSVDSRSLDKSLQRLRRTEKAKWTSDKGWVAS